MNETMKIAETIAPCAGHHAHEEGGRLSLYLLHLCPLFAELSGRQWAEAFIESRANGKLDFV
jgi:hypothetical protein